MEKIFTSWPFYTFLFAVIFVILFRGEIKTFLARVKSISKSGITAGTTPEAQREDQKKEAMQELLDEIGNNIVLKDVETTIRADLQSRKLEAGDSVTILIKHLAATKILLEFEQVHNLIFGSQIYLLKKLNEVRGQGIAKEKVLDHFKHVQKMFPEQLGTWTGEQYLSFIMGRALITTQNGIYHITNIGVEYLAWIARNGRREDKPL